MVRRTKAVTKTSPTAQRFRSCPTCGGRPVAVLQQLLGEAQLTESGDFSGTTDVDWDSQEDVVDPRAGRTLYCAQRHEYFERDGRARELR